MCLTHQMSKNTQTFCAHVSDRSGLFIPNIDFSVPNTSRSMVGYLILPSPFPLFHRIIQKEINQHSIDLRLWMIPQDLSPDQLYTPYTTAYSRQQPPSPISRAQHIPLIWISHVCPLSMTFFCLTACSSSGLYHRHPNIFKIWGTR